MLCSTNGTRINIREHMRDLTNYIKDRNEHLVYFNRCIDDALKYKDVNEDEIRELKEIIATLEKEIVDASYTVEKMRDIYD